MEAYMETLAITIIHGAYLLATTATVIIIEATGMVQDAGMGTITNAIISVTITMGVIMVIAIVTTETDIITTDIVIVATVFLMTVIEIGMNIAEIIGTDIMIREIEEIEIVTEDKLF